MSLRNKNKQNREGGFALVTALIACAILFALAMLVIYLSTGDLRISARSIGDKKAMNAAEAGIHRLTQTFNPLNLAASAATNVQVDAANDPASRYTISTPTLPTSGPPSLHIAGYSIGGGTSWGQIRYNVNVEGINTTYGTKVDLLVGIGYGPVNIDLSHP